MQFPVKAGAPAAQQTSCAVVAVFDRRWLPPASRAIDKASGGAVGDRLKSGDASTKPGRTLYVPGIRRGKAKSVLLVGCGDRRRFGAKQLAAAASAAAGALKDLGVREAVSFLGYDAVADADDYYRARAVVQAFRSAFYRFDELKSSTEPAYRLRRLGIAVADDDAAGPTRAGVEDAVAIANGMDLARDLGNRPANVCTPTHLAGVAREIAKSHANFQCKVLGESDVRRLGMGALLSVTQGADEAVRFIVLHYRGAGDRAPVVLCGKGVTFDTGGISLKPPPKMDEMKFDMCGAASVLGAMASIGELQPEINVTALIPACENMPGGHATRPGDIVKSLSGQTIEILNTDAEGRLILSDALSYAKQFEPKYLIDVATLTGACVVALGHVHSGLFSADEDLAGQLAAAGRRSLDSAWRMPVDDEYGESLKSNFADFANVGSRDGGACIAAQFLSRFTGGAAWAHLDIAGVAWSSDARKGATGRPVPLLVDFLLNVEQA
jgi:leucyl aminopeptidase